MVPRDAPYGYFFITLSFPLRSKRASSTSRASATPSLRKSSARSHSLMCSSRRRSRSIWPSLMMTSEVPLMSFPKTLHRTAIAENDQCKPTRTAIAPLAGRRGAFPVIARLATDPTIIPRITSNTVAPPIKRFFAYSNDADGDDINDDSTQCHLQDIIRNRRPHSSRCWSLATN